MLKTPAEGGEKLILLSKSISNPSRRREEMRRYSRLILPLKLRTPAGGEGK
jgi:hypothetical protein